MTTNFLYAQAPNRKGNVSKSTPSKSGGATNVTGASHGTATPKGNQGAPKASGNVYPVGNKVSVSTPKCYDKTPRNDAYMNSDRNNYLK
jgi:hypothetical protein